MKHALWLAMPLLLIAAQDAPAPYALATLNVRQGGTRDAEGVYRGGTFHLVDSYTPPAEHGPRDALIAFEGPGWESDQVAYRLYLDERNVPDIYGKKLPGPILPRIGQGKDDYHAMADWGQDILQVNQSLGTGGIGVWRWDPKTRKSSVTQLGRSRISAAVHNSPAGASVEVTSLGFQGERGPADLVATYSIAPGSRVTKVDARASGSVPAMIAGIIRHPNVTIFKGAAGKWSYIGTWGDQSLAKDGLGIALFYRADEAVPIIGETDIAVLFCNPWSFRYAFAAAWIQEPAAPKSGPAFDAWMKQTAAELDQSDTVAARGYPCVLVQSVP